MGFISLVEDIYANKQPPFLHQISGLINPKSLCQLHLSFRSDKSSSIPGTLAGVLGIIFHAVKPRRIKRCMWRGGGFLANISRLETISGTLENLLWKKDHLYSVTGSPHGKPQRQPRAELPSAARRAAFPCAVEPLLWALQDGAGRASGSFRKKETPWLGGYTRPHFPVDTLRLVYRVVVLHPRVRVPSSAGALVWSFLWEAFLDGLQARLRFPVAARWRLQSSRW